MVTNADPATLMMTKIDHPDLIHKASTLVNSGVLEQEGKYYFLNIDDQFIHELYPLIEDYAFIQKPDYFGLKNSIGAHITFVYPEEDISLDPSDIGSVHNFSISEFCSAILGDKEYFVLTVTSPTLSHLRAKYDLDPYPKYKNVRLNFHITFGVRFLVRLCE